MLGESHEGEEEGSTEITERSKRDEEVGLRRVVLDSPEQSNEESNEEEQPSFVHNTSAPDKETSPH